MSNSPPLLRRGSRTPRRLFLFVLGAVASLPLGAAEAGAVDETKQQADRWIELEMRIANERNEWRTQKQILETSREVLQREQTSLQSKLEANELATSLFRTRFEAAEAELAQHETAHETLNARCAELQERLGQLRPHLPQPLLDKIDPMWTKLENHNAEDPISVSERIQNIVGILSAIDQFNNNLTLTHELRENAAGEKLDIKVLYWGLAVAYAVDARREGAWVVVPTDSGWEWRDQRANAAEIAALIAIYEKQQSPGLITLPATIAGGAQ